MFLRHGVNHSWIYGWYEGKIPTTWVRKYVYVIPNFLFLLNNFLNTSSYNQILDPSLVWTLLRQLYTICLRKYELQFNISNFFA